MVSSDDEYGFDDLVLDERTLAVLDATERGLAAAIPSTSHSRSPTEQQPTKRSRQVMGGPASGQQPRRSKSRFSLEDTDLPEITISNGFYSGPGRFFVGSQQSESPASPKALHNSRGDADSDVVLLPTPTQQGILLEELKRIASTSILPGSRKAPSRHPSPALTYANASRTAPMTRSSSFSDTMRAALRSALSEVDSPAIRRSSSTTSSNPPSPPSAAAPRAYFQESVPVPTQATAHSRLERLSHLQHRGQSLPPQHLQPHRLTSQREASTPRPARVSQIVTQRQRTPLDQTVLPVGDLPAFQDDLESLRAQVEEIGEVEVLRANLERAKTAHNEETEKLREAKENLKTAQVTAQKQQEAELESLRTQLIFKQHEIEASRRAVPRVPAPSQPAGLSQTQRSDVPRTPHSLHVAIPDCQSPRPVAPPPRLSKARPPPPGFVNAFALPLQKKNKGKARASVLEESRRTHEQDLDLPPLSPIGAPAKALAYSQPDEGMEIDGGQAGGTTYPEVDFHMDLANDVKMPQPVAEVLRASKSFDWVNWMRKLVLAHATSPHAPSTIQLLLAQPPLGANHTSVFHAACTSLIGAVVGSAGYEPVVRIVANSLAQIANILLLDVRLKPLISTLNLLRHLVICLPSFVENLLKAVDAPPFLQTICAIIVNVLRPPNTNSKEPHFLDLGKEYQPQLAVIPHTTDVLTMMLSKDQPPFFLENSVRTLSYLSTRAGIFRSLLSFSEDTPESARDFAKLPQVDRMCALLMDTGRTGSAGHSICASVLTTLISLAIAHEDAVLILSESPFFIPSLVKLLANLSTTLWEEDPELTVSEVLPLSSIVAGIARGMLLLHYVIFRIPNGPASLRARLQAAPPRHFNGIGHQFVVALGRLSFAEPPDEVSGSDRMLLEQLADPARDVMDLVVAGPESESVWSLFQEDEGRGEERRHDGQRDGSDNGFADEETVMQVDMDVLQDSSQLEYL
ncbi:hypothetical protein BJV77DRAFT_1031962 [Russula vinacea]|nr:hypothetical protein BJV77DRAFT_1031962 [Russula vinacea]